MLVNCVAYRRGERLADIPISEIRSQLTDPGCFVPLTLAAMAVINMYLVCRF